MADKKLIEEAAKALKPFAWARYSLAKGHPLELCDKHAVDAFPLYDDAAVVLSGDELRRALEKAVAAGEYVVGLVEDTGNRGISPDPAVKSDWLGTAMHCYAAMAFLTEAREALAGEERPEPPQETHCPNCHHPWKQHDPDRGCQGGIVHRDGDPDRCECMAFPGHPAAGPSAHPNGIWRSDIEAALSGEERPEPRPLNAADQSARDAGCNCDRKMPYIDWSHDKTCPLYRALGELYPQPAFPGHPEAGPAELPGEERPEPHANCREIFSDETGRYRDDRCPSCQPPAAPSPGPVEPFAFHYRPGGIDPQSPEEAERGRAQESTPAGPSEDVLHIAGRGYYSLERIEPAIRAAWLQDQYQTVNAFIGNVRVGLGAAPEKADPAKCPNCGRSDGWHKAAGHPPSPVGDCRKIVWMRDKDEMEWWGVRAYNHAEGYWQANSREESATVLFWMETPHNPFYPVAVVRADAEGK